MRPQRRSYTFFRRAGKVVGIAGIVLVACVLLLLLAFSFRSVREVLLDRVAERAEVSLPGTILMAKATWPAMGRIEIENLVWVDQPDTLGAAERLVLDVKLLSLFKRDVRISEILIEGVRADLPGIKRRFPGRETGESDTTQKRGKRFFPRGGSLPGFPSIAIDRVSLTAEVIYIGERDSLQNLPEPAGGVLTEEGSLSSPDRRRITIDAAGNIDLSRGRAPKIVLERLTAADSETGNRIDHMRVNVDLASAKMDGRGSGRIAPQFPFFFRLESSEKNQFALFISESEKEVPPDAVGLALTGVFERRGLDLHSLQYEATIKTPGTGDLAAIPSLTRHFENLTALEGLTATARGRIELRPDFTAGADIELRPNAWFEGGRASLVYQRGVLDIDTVVIALPELMIEANASIADDSIAAFIHATVLGTRWLQNVKKSFEAPDTLYADATVEMLGTRETPRVLLRCEANGRKGALEIDKLRIKAEAPGNAQEPIIVRLEAESRGLAVSTNAHIEPHGEQALRLAPFVVQYASEPSRPGLEAARTGLVNYANGRLSVDNFRVAGALGDFRLDGKIGRNLTGSYRIRCRWPEIPDILINSLDLSAERSDSLGVRWLRAGPFRADIAGQLVSDSITTKNRMVTTFNIPGPSVFSSVLSQAARLDDLGPVRGRFALETLLSQSGTHYNLDLDLNTTDWIDSSEVRLDGTGSRLNIDTFELSFEDTHLGLRGGFRDSTLDLHSDLNVNSARLLRRFGLGDESLDLSAQARVNLTGNIDSPVLNASVTARSSALNFRVPRVTVNVLWSQNGLVANLDVPQGLVTPMLKLARATVSYKSKTNERTLFPGEIVLSGEGSGVDFFQKTSIDRAADRLTLLGDSLVLNLSGRDLRTFRPFRIDFFPAEEKVEIIDLHLSGSLGEIRGEGSMDPEEVDLDFFVDLFFPRMPSSLKLPPALWPERCNIRLRAADKHRLYAEANIRGVTFPDNRQPDVRIEISAVPDTFFTTITVNDKMDSIVTCRLQLPTSFRVYPPKAQLRDGPLFCDLVLAGFPVPTEFRGGFLSGTRHAECDAILRARGSTASPDISAKAAVTFPTWPKLSPYRLNLEARLDAAGHRDSIPRHDVGMKTSRPRAIEDLQGYNGLAALLTVEKEEQRLIESVLLFPLSFSALPLIVEVKDGRELEFTLASGELTLSEFDALLPPDTEMEGKCRIDLAAHGPIDEPEFDGLLDVPHMRVSISDGSRVSTQGFLRLGGTARRPTLKGEIEIQNGLLRVPDPPKNLHPTDGSAILWEQQTTDSLDGDGVQNVIQGKTLESSKKEKVEAEIDVSIKIPSGLWIRGQGLDVELAGDLRLAQKGQYPRVVGELRAVRGNMVFVGRNFNMDRGSVVFYGEDEINPALDIALATNVEGVTIRITFRGTVKEPELSLTSEPEMPEGDILSFLIFGKPIGDLDHDQTAMVQRRAGELATSFGLTQLKMRLSRQLGVDMVSIEKAGRDETQKSLVIGKYLSRRVLLKYGQMLEEQSNFFVNLEYFITRNFKIETIIGRQQQSGIEADWTKEY